MKKKFVRKAAVLIIAVLTIAVLYSCDSGDETVSLKMGEAAVLEGYLSFTPENVLISKEIYPPIGKDFAMGWKSEESDKTYVAFVAHIKNLTDEAMSADELCAFRIRAGEKTYDGSIAATLSEGDSNFDYSGEIKSGETKTTYFITEMDKSSLSQENTVEFAFREDENKEPIYGHQISVDMTKKILITKPLVLNQEIEIDGTCSLTPKSVKFKDVLLPSNPAYVYHYFEMEGKDKKLLILTVRVKNLTEAKATASSFFGISAVYKDKYEYRGSVAADDKDRANITANEKIDPLESRTAYGIANVYQAAEKDGCDLYLYAGGTYYLYHYGNK